MRKSAWKWVGAGLVCLIAAAAPAAAAEAQQEMTPEQKAQMEIWMKAMTPGVPHQQMAARTGTWQGTVTFWEKPGGPPQVNQGKSVRHMSLGGRVMVDEWTGMAMGMPFEGLGSTGYDNAAKRWWTTWSDNMGTGVMTANGQCDADSKKGCTFTNTGFDPITSKEVKTRSTVSWPSSEDERMEMFGPGPDGKEFKMMEIVLKRTAK